MTKVKKWLPQPNTNTLFPLYIPCPSETCPISTLIHLFIRGLEQRPLLCSTLILIHSYILVLSSVLLSFHTHTLTSIVRTHSHSFIQTYWFGAVFCFRSTFILIHSYILVWNSVLPSFHIYSHWAGAAFCFHSTLILIRVQSSILLSSHTHSGLEQHSAFIPHSFPFGFGAAFCFRSTFILIRVWSSVLLSFRTHSCSEQHFAFVPHSCSDGQNSFSFIHTFWFGAAICFCSTLMF